MDKYLVRISEDVTFISDIVAALNGFMAGVLCIAIKMRGGKDKERNREVVHTRDAFTNFAISAIVNSGIVRIGVGATLDAIHGLRWLLRRGSSPGNSPPGNSPPGNSLPGNSLPGNSSTVGEPAGTSLLLEETMAPISDEEMNEEGEDFGILLEELEEDEDEDEAEEDRLSTDTSATSSQEKTPLPSPSTSPQTVPTTPFVLHITPQQSTTNKLNPLQAP